jgi:hypothetical protein
MEKIRIGIDIGNVIFGGGGEDTSFFGDNFLNTPTMEGSFEAIASLSQTYDIWLISKCGQKVQDKTLLWFAHHEFFEATGVNPEQVIFCRKRPEKAGIAESLGLRAFIDDREDIIESMKGIVDQPILFTSWAETHVHPPLFFKAV